VGFFLGGFFRWVYPKKTHRVFFGYVPGCLNPATLLVSPVCPSVCLSVRLSIPYGLLTREWKGVEKPKLASTFHKAGLTGVTILSSKGQMSSGPKSYRKWRISAATRVYLRPGPRHTGRSVVGVQLEDGRTDCRHKALRLLCLLLCNQLLFNKSPLSTPRGSTKQLQ